VKRVVVRGSGDVGSAVAQRLFRADFCVALHDDPHPPVSRRGMAFSDAIFDGQTTLEGVTAVRCDDLGELDAILNSRHVIPVFTGDFPELMLAVQPRVLINARMRKRAQPESQIGLASLTIGLGPGFVAGSNVDLAIETSWSAPGKIVRNGPTLRLGGEPKPIAGVGRERYVYAPAAGTFQTDQKIGALVAEGQIVAHIDPVPITAPIDGTIRGLTRHGVPVDVGAKVLEIDPRGIDAVVTGIGERPSMIADGVLRAIQEVFSST
jgi:xanthine dehydrogenase accessory factor